MKLFFLIHFISINIVLSIPNDIGSRQNSFLPYTTTDNLDRICPPYSQLINKKPPVEATVRETCHLCQHIIMMIRRYPSVWKIDTKSICSSIPKHLSSLCTDYICRLYRCPDFGTEGLSTCNEKTPYFDDSIDITPCNSQHTCWRCLGIPREPAVGCFDNYYQEMPL